MASKGAVHTGLWLLSPEFSGVSGDNCGPNVRGLIGNFYSDPKYPDRPGVPKHSRASSTVAGVKLGQSHRDPEASRVPRLVLVIGKVGCFAALGNCASTMPVPWVYRLVNKVQVLQF